MVSGQGMALMNGVIVVYKEPGFTSHDVVAKLRGILHQKKIGHTGTLDPDAEGVLPVCLGKATRLCDMLTDETKTYEAVALLGRVTDTQDSSGRTLEEYPVTCSGEEVRQCLLSFQGEQSQIPPMYSALKQGGRKLYELAREGKEVEREPRKVHFYQIEIMELNLPRVVFRVTCSKGTYIRTLCHDLGARLGCGACMDHLTRVRVGRFGLKEARKLSQIQELQDQGGMEQCLIPTDQIFAELPAYRVRAEADGLAHNGNPLEEKQLVSEEWGQKSLLVAKGEKGEQEKQKGLQEPGEVKKEGQVRLYDSEGIFVGIFRWREGLYRPLKMFYDGTR